MADQNIFQLLYDDPADYYLKTMKAEMALTVMESIRSQGWTQTVAAEKLHISQPRVSNLFRGKLDKFTLDSLMTLLLRSGHRVETDFSPRDETTPLRLEIKRAAR